MSFATLDTFVGKSKPEMNSRAVFFVLTDERSRWPFTASPKNSFQSRPKKETFP